MFSRPTCVNFTTGKTSFLFFYLIFDSIYLPNHIFILRLYLLKGNGNIFFIFSCERTFKTIYNTLLPFFHILLTSTNILIERNEISAIFNFCRYACHITTGVTQYFYLDKHSSFCIQNYTLSAK